MKRHAVYRLGLLVTVALGLGGTVLAAAPQLREVGGSVEQRSEGGAWQTAAAGQAVLSGLRVGTGRALLQSADPFPGNVLLASGSTLGYAQDELRLLSGQFYISGQTKFFAQGAHFAPTGQVRLDLQGATQRVAVISGELRMSSERVSVLRAGQQYDFQQKKVLPFTERDPWYVARFIGPGEARVEALSGAVTLQRAEAGPNRPVVPVAAMQPGEVLQTGENAWAEIGFTGGGYLRLQPQSALSVLSVDKLSSGRQVTLKLLRGSAWNVVAKKQGEYQLITPTISTAVRGTTFRVDSSGLVKVFEGQVALPSSADALLGSGQQREISGVTAPLQLDASDRLNIAQDAARAAPTTLRLALPSSQAQFDLHAISQPTAQLSAEVDGQTYPLTADAAGHFALKLPSLPEGNYIVHVVAQRYDQTLRLTQRVRVDRSAPQLSDVHLLRLGHLLLLSAAVSDAAERVVLSAQMGAGTVVGQVPVYRRTLKPGAFRWALPLALPATQLATLRLSAKDLAGNTFTLTLTVPPSAAPEPVNVSHAAP